MNATPCLSPVVLEEATAAAAPAAAPPGLATSIGDLHQRWQASAPAAARGGPAPGLALSLARARRMRQGGRKVWLWVVLFYAAAQLALVLVMDHWHPTLTDSWMVHKWEQMRRLVARNPDRPLLLMIGSSRTDDAFQAGRLNGLPGPGGKPFVAYNFGVPMVGPLRENLYLKEMLEAGIRPRLLLIEFLPVFFNESHKHFVSEENWTFPPYMTLPQLVHLWPYLEHPQQMGKGWLEARLAPWFAVRCNLCRQAKETLGPVPSPIKDSGWNYWVHDDWGFRLPKPFDQQECLRGWVGTHDTFWPTLQGLKIGAGPLRSMRDLLDRCRREGIPAVLVLMPESAEFRRWYCPEGLARARRLFVELGREYGIDALDASEWVADWDFRDGHHVLAGGAATFTTRLIEELRPILARLGEAAPDRPAVAAASRP